MLIADDFAPPQSSEYRTAKPFSHVVMNGLWKTTFLERVDRSVRVFSDWDGEKSFSGSIAKRWCSQWSKFPRPVSHLIAYSSRPEFLRLLESITGEVGLVPDPYLQGAGIHSTATGGFLKMHADFTWHNELQLYRRLNLLIYLNQDWNEAWGGNLNLARRGDGGELIVEKSVYPHFNTSVLFTTDDHSFHGQPDPMTLPAGIYRNSIALYYYVAKKPDGVVTEARTRTDYRNEAGERLRKRPVKSS